MNFEFCDQASFSNAQGLINSGSTKEGVAVLLEARDLFAKQELTNGVNCSNVINAAIKKLQEDPYMTLGLSNTCSATDIKKAYRKLALKYHPDKNAATSLLFTVIQDSYDTLSDEEKRSAYDIRKRRQEASMEKLRKQRPAPGASHQRRPSTTSAGANRPYSAKQRHAHNSHNTEQANNNAQQSSGPKYAHAHNFRGYRADKNSKPASTNDYVDNRKKSPRPEPTADPSRRYSKQPMPQPRKEPWQHDKDEPKERGEDVRKASENLRQKNKEADTAAERLRQFNKKFYQEFKQNAKSAATAGTDAKYKQAAGMGGGDKAKPSAPSKPKNVRFTHRDDTTVTLCWESDAVAGHNVAYELQWRQRGKRKKNLECSTCYEFRLRAASAFGWSGYSESVKVMTCDKGNNEGPAGKKEKAAAAAEKRRGSAAQPSSSRPNTPGEVGPDGVKRTNSWAWRRDGEAEGPNSTNTRTPRNAPSGAAYFRSEQQPSQQSTAKKTGKDYNPWNCVVCKRANSADCDACTVCFTKKDYKKKARPQRKSMAESPTHKGNNTQASNAAKDTTASEFAEEARKAAQAQTKRPQTTAGTPTNIQFEAVAKEEKPWWVLEEEENKAKAAAAAAAKGEKVEKEETVPRGPSIRVSSTPAPRKPSPQRSRRGASPTRAEEVDTDDEYVEEDTWEYDEEVDTTFESYTSGKSKNTPRGKNATKGRVAPDEVESDTEDVDGNATWMLNTSETRLHNVRREPFKDSPVIGHLLTDTKISSIASCGDWLKVKYHRPYDPSPYDSSGEEKKTLSEDVYGWCLRRKDASTYLLSLTNEGYAELDEEIDEVPSPTREAASPVLSSSSPVPSDDGLDSGSEKEKDTDEEWYELRDDDGELYYFNSATGVSQWEPPKWFAEVDEISGVRYYVNTSTGEPQWEVPEDYVKCVREEAYSTPEAEFVKSMLSPKRSRYGSNMFKASPTKVDKEETLDV
ncbi:hypothetical protein TrVE_jg8417 [Triparma verrucosa]|uniref:Uncharacterized protein n=1 Tax=Triparma verrucosa TaxID=1606542 RepID=A0A9W7CKN2_9STRA|nr:hypothetical protein TrVE_jg8417 [Triparma verrucosa]